MAQIKDKVSNFFAWARKGKGPVAVEVARRDDPDAEGPGKEVTIQQLKQGYGEVVETMQSVRTHLEQQANRSEQMLELMRDLPAVLKAIPESTQTQTRMLEAIHSNLDRQNETSGQLSSAITGLASAAGQQERTLTEIHTHLAEEHETRGQLTQGVTALNDTLGHVMDSNVATRESMGAVVEQNRVNDERMRLMFQRSQKMNTMMVLLCLALATGALALGGYMAVLVSRLGPTPAPAVIQKADAAETPVSTTNTPAPTPAPAEAAPSVAPVAAIVSAGPVATEAAALVEQIGEVAAATELGAAPTPTPVEPGAEPQVEAETNRTLLDTEIVGPPSPR